MSSEALLKQFTGAQKGGSTAHNGKSYVKNADGTMAKKQISEAGYNAFWKEDDDKELYDFLHEVNSIGSSFVVSGVLYHNGQTCWMLDKLISDGFSYKQLNFDYNKVSRAGKKDTIEIIVKNF